MRIYKSIAFQLSLALLLASSSMTAFAQDNPGNSDANVFLPMVTSNQPQLSVPPTDTGPFASEDASGQDGDENLFTLGQQNLDVGEIVQEQEVTAAGVDTACPSTVYKVGGTNLSTNYYTTFYMPYCLRDADGGTIRLIMQHETKADDEIRIIDLHVATEWSSNAYGARGRRSGITGWTRQSGGGDYKWVLGDSARHTIGNPWGWAWAVDYKWGQGNGLLGGNYFRVYSHPHVTTRVIFKD